MSNELMHYGMPRRSGRYPWGSGKEPYQHSGDWLSRVESLKKDGLDQKAIIEQMNSYNKDHGYDILSTTEFRTLNAIASNQRSMDNIKTAQRLRDKEGLTTQQIAERMGQPWSTVKGWLDEDVETSRRQVAMATKDFLKEQVEKKGFIDVGLGTELVASEATGLNVSKDKMNEALYMLELDEGCKVVNIGIPQATSGQQTVTRVLCKPGYSTDKEAMAAAYKARNENKLATLEDISEEYYTNDNGNSYHPNVFQKPTSVDPKRVYIRWNEEGGGDKEGVVEMRRTPDLDLGKQAYAQVRILVNDSHYIKGMAVHSDNIPEGYDIVLNTNKSREKYSKIGEDGKSAVLKPIKDDPNDPFGAGIKAEGQHYYETKDGQKILSPINKIKGEGSYDHYDKTKLSAQFLSKQPVELVKKQADISIADRKAEYEEIMAINNPTVKRKMLIEYADKCDKAASDLNLAALPRQTWSVILPANSLKENEVYAPNFKDGEKIALVRYPHGSITEIPICTVRNKNQECIRNYGKNPMDCVAINPKVAQRLSGADFDGDTVLCIPTGGKVNIRNASQLEGLKGFDTQMAYPYRPGIKTLPKSRVQQEMGSISNLITDMTIQGVPIDSPEMCRAIKHSMVIIDAEKHKLDYKRSEEENGIKELKLKYQGHLNAKGNISTSGNTLISRAGAEVRIDKYKGQYKINQKGKEWYDPTRPEGAKLYKTDDAMYQVTKKDPKTGEKIYTGKYAHRQQNVTQMSLTDDARTLSTGTRVENIYANYANTCKDLANKARISSTEVGLLKRNPSAVKTYSKEVASLNEKYKEALKNKPRERNANAMAYSIVRAKYQDNPKMTSKEMKKEKQKAIEYARDKVGARGKKYRFYITDKEWEAIQAGAVSDHRLMELLNSADQERVKELTYPKVNQRALSTAQTNKIKAMSGTYTQAEIADILGLSLSTVNNVIHS